MFKGNEAQLNFLRKKSSEYYKGILMLAERLSEVREIKVVDLLGYRSGVLWTMLLLFMM